MTDNKAQTLLTDWAANLISPESSTSFYDKNVLAFDSASYSKHAFRSDIPLYKGGTTLDVYRQRISCLLKDQLTELQLKAAFESIRVCRRLIILRELANEQKSNLFPRSTRACSSHSFDIRA